MYLRNRSSAIIPNINTLIDVVSITLNLEEQLVLSTSALPSLDFLGVPKTTKGFPVYLLYAVFLYGEWDNPDKLTVPPKHSTTRVTI